MRRYNFWVLTAVLLFLTSGRPSEEMFCHKPGIKGHVYLVKGNQMPSPDRPPSAPVGIKTELYIYELTNTGQVTRSGETAFYSSISTRLVKKIVTDKKGAFKVKLPPGSYSLFVKKGDLFYANQFDGKNNIYPIEVLPKKMTEVDFRADYDAVY